MTLSEKMFQNDELLSTFMECTYGESATDPAVELYDNKLSHLFIQEPTVEIPATFIALDLEFPSDFLASSIRTLSMKKRKSEDWDSKPLEKRQANGNHKCEFAALAQEFSLDSELSHCSDMFVDMLVSETNQVFDCKNPSQPKQRRARWTDTEVDALWNGMEKYGNNWRAINQNCLPLRTYYQVKDKGRRCLTSNGWISGLPDSDEASYEAKRIAKRNNSKSRRR